jgi:transposase-like protein
MLDGTGFGDHTLVVALGIDVQGRKEVLGVAEGSTENEAVCRRLLANLVDRGLPAERARLFVIDGGKGLRKAIRGIFGDWALVQRCQFHKIRNVVEHLPKGKRAWVKAAMRKAYASETFAQARSRLLDLARLLAAHPGAAASLREGLEETLTILRLGSRGALARTLATTNPIENLQGTLKRISRNVKRWRDGGMALRWAVTGLLEARKSFRRVKGYPGTSSLPWSSGGNRWFEDRGLQWRRRSRVECRQRSPSPINGKRDIAFSHTAALNSFSLPPTNHQVPSANE